MGGVIPQRKRSFVYQGDEELRALPSALVKPLPPSFIRSAPCSRFPANRQDVCTPAARREAGELAGPAPAVLSGAKGMNYEQTETAINAHIEAYRLFTRAQHGGVVEKLEEFSACEFERRRALLEGRGHSNETETRRLTYIVGFMIVSQVSGGERLAGEMVGAP